MSNRSRRAASFELSNRNRARVKRRESRARQLFWLSTLCTWPVDSFYQKGWLIFHKKRDFVRKSFGCQDLRLVNLSYITSFCGLGIVYHGAAQRTRSGKASHAKTLKAATRSGERGNDLAEMVRLDAEIG